MYSSKFKLLRCPLQIPLTFRQIIGSFISQLEWNKHILLNRLVFFEGRFCFHLKPGVMSCLRARNFLVPKQWKQIPRIRSITCVMAEQKTPMSSRRGIVLVPGEKSSACIARVEGARTIYSFRREFAAGRTFFESAANYNWTFIAIVIAQSEMQISEAGAPRKMKSFILLRSRSWTNPKEVFSGDGIVVFSWPASRIKFGRCPMARMGYGLSRKEDSDWESSVQ